MQQQSQYAEQYQIHCPLGDGGQANVYLASRNQELFAVKVYQLGASKLQAFQREVNFLTSLKHQYLINIVESKIDGKVKLAGKQEEKRPIIVLQYAEGGELFDLLRGDGGLKPKFSRRIFKQLLQCLEYLAEKGISHRDIKPENILFDKDFNVKVSDFGLSTIYERQNSDHILTTKLGTEGYKSPQMEQGKYKGIESDMFAAGVTLFVMHNGGPPFLSTKTSDKIYKHIRDQNFIKFWSLHEKKKETEFFSSSFKQFLNAFFSHQPSKRPNFDNIKQFNWMNEECCSEEELKAELRKRYEKLMEQDDQKQQISKIKQQLAVSEVKDDEETNSSEASASRLKKCANVSEEQTTDTNNSAKLLH